MTEILISLLVLLGGLLMLLGSVALWRLPDVYSRTAGATKSVTFGVGATMLATFLYFIYSAGLFSGKLLLTIVFIFLTAPIAALMISRSAYHKGVPLWEKSKYDDLKEDLRKKEAAGRSHESE